MRARPPHAPAQGPMLASARRRALKATAVYGVLPVFSHNVGRAISPALQHKAHGPQNREQRAAAPPAKRGARPCRTLRDISAANRQCTPQSAPSGASSSPCRGAFLCVATPEASPARGGVAAGDGGVPHLALQIPFRAAVLSRPPHLPQNAGQGPAGPCGIFPPQTGNAPLRLRLPAHPAPLAGEPSGLQTGGPCKLPAAPRGLKHH